MSYRQLWDSLDGAPKLLAMSVNTRNNGLTVGVDAVDAPAAQSFATIVSQRFEVPVSVRPEPIARDTACTDRDHCSNPLKPGIRLAKGDTTIDDCTMAFHIFSTITDVSFVTAGHCGYSGSDCWYHQGYAGPNGRRVGCEFGEKLLKQDGRDIMRVGMFDSQATEDIYGTTIHHLDGWIEEPSFLGAVVKASRGKSDNISTGTTTDDWISWISDQGGNVRVWGLDTDIPSNPGDSGSPVFMYYAQAAGWYAVGTLSNALGRVTYFDACYDKWGSSGCWLWLP